MLQRSKVVAVAVLSLVGIACADDSTAAGKGERDAAANHARSTIADSAISRSDASADATCLPCLPPVDAGLSRDASLSIPDPSCRMVDAPSCDVVPCTWREANEKASACGTPPRIPFFAARCDEYDALVSQGTDAQEYFLYDKHGKLVAINVRGLEPTCMVFDAAFSLPARCTTVTPKCPGEEDAGS